MKLIYLICFVFLLGIVNVNAETWKYNYLDSEVQSSIILDISNESVNDTLHWNGHAFVYGAVNSIESDPVCSAQLSNYLFKNGSNANTNIDIGYYSLSLLNLYGNLSTIFSNSHIANNNFNIETKDINAINLNTGIDYCNSISLKKGWNVISIIPNMSNITYYDDKNISLVAGWNLIGTGSLSSINVIKTYFTNSSGYIYLNPLNVIAFYEGESNSGLSQGNALATYLRPNKGYWLYANESGNLTLPSVGGTREGETYAWNKLRFVNSTGYEMNITDAQANTWIEGTLKYYNPEVLDFRPIYSTYNSFLKQKTNTSSLEGLFIYSYKDNLTLILDNSTCLGKTYGGNAIYNNVTALNICNTIGTCNTTTQILNAINNPSVDLSPYWNTTKLLNGTLVQNNSSPTFVNMTATITINRIVSGTIYGTCTNSSGYTFIGNLSNGAICNQ